MGIASDGGSESVNTIVANKKLLLYELLKVNFLAKL